MTISNYDGIISNRAAGRDDDRWIMKTGTVGGIANNWYCHWKSAGSPTSAVLTAATSGGAIMTSTSVGALSFPAATASTCDRHLLTYGAVVPSGAELTLTGLIDVLWAGGSIQVGSSSTQTIGSPALTRSTDGVQNLIGVCIATNLTTGTTMTVWYTDSGGTATSIDAVLATAGGPGRFTPSQYFGLPTPNGVKSIQSVQVQTAQTAGAVDIMIFRPLTFVPNLGAGIYCERDQTGQIDGIKLLPKDSSNCCGFITPVAFFTGTTARAIQGFVRTVAG